MYLKSIELQGFKSFPEKTTLSFKEGITVIIGPNGSGKSNIADAMRWVLGEVSSRNIRGTKMEDIIFGGSETRKPSSFAQVSLTLDNSGEEDKLPIEYDEVTVTRRYFRGGDSDYLINGKQCRLKDIHALFMNTGIGKGGYSVIGQGRIAEIVSLKSEDRRIVFEEAAGISKYKFSKNEALKKLTATQENLTRLNDINSVLASRVGPLEKESEKARKYMEIYEEKRMLDIALWLYDMAELTKRIASLRGTFEIYSNDLEMTETEADKLAEQTTALFDTLQELKRQTEKCNTELSKTQNDRTEATNRAAFATAEAQNLKEKIEELNERLKNLKESLSDAQRTKNERETALRESKDKDAELSAKEKAAQAAYDGICAKIDQCAKEISDIAEKTAEINDEMIDLRIALTVTDSTDSADTEKTAELDALIAAQNENIAKLEEELSSAEESFNKFAQKREITAKKLSEVKEKLVKAEEKQQTLKRKKDDADVAYQVAERKAEALKRLEELFEGYSRATRFVMDEAKKGVLKGVYAPVSQLISVPEKYTTAIECSLGSALQNIVVTDEAAAKAAMYALKNAGAGRTTFLPVATVKPSYLSQDITLLKKMRGFEGVASDLVSTDKKFEDICKNLLGRTAVFDNIDNAVACAREFGYKIRITTLDGQQINAGGSFTGGSGIKDSGILSRGREIESLSELMKKCKNSSEQAGTELKELDTLLQSLSLESDNLTAEDGITAALQNEASSAVKVAQARLDEAYARADETEAEKSGITEKAEVRRKKREEDAARLQELTAQIKLLTDKSAELDSDMNKYNADQQSLRTALEDARIKAAENARGTAAYQASLYESESTCEVLEQSIAAANDRLASYRDKLTENAEKSGKTTTDLTAYEQHIKELEAQIKELSEKVEQTEAKCTSARNSEREKNEQKQQLIEKKIQAESKLENAENEREKLKGVLEENYELSYSEAKEKAVEYNCPEITESNRPEHYKRQTELKGRIRALGHVNVSAIEEYQEVKKQHDELTAQIADLTSSETDLLEIIEKLDNEMKTGFVRAFENINLHFGQVFKRLFGGGTAELVLRDPDNVLESGIDINVAPPGKIIKSLSLLSGGEQSFVAIAIYLALLEVNPTPFIMLDEIEAALDEVNVDRFAQYIKETRDKTQFIMITHRRGTMEVAEKLYGVTMPTKGITKVLSVDINEIEEKLGKLE
ncbi:MAG: chromosome segregation protein SMC [Clostridia bacterium]|nr:chromosome segregation protein SMC [Clostridia bacterium]